MSTKLDLLSLSEQELVRLYAERIEPILKTQEEERGKAMIVFRGRAVLVALAAMAAAAFVGWWFQGIIEGLFAGGTVGLAGMIYAYQPLQQVASATKQQSLSSIAEAIGCSYRLAGFEAAGVRQLEELKLLPSCDRASYQDCFSGSHAGCAFSFHDGHRERRVKTKNGERWDTVFRGQLVRVAFPKEFLGTTVIRRDAGLFNFMQRWFTQLQRVGLGDSRLEKAFEVYASDQVEARYLIHPVFMERLLALEQAFDGKNLRGAFVGGDLLVAIEGGDKFEIGTMFSSLVDIARVRTIVNDITEIMRLIEAVLTAEQGALPISQKETGPASPSP